VDHQAFAQLLGNYGEFFGAVAVVASLIYLAAQIRQNSRQVEEQVRALRQQAFDSAGDDFSALRLHISGTPQLSSLWRRTKESYISLEPDEKAQANELLHELMWAYQSILLSNEGWGTDEELREVVDQNIRYWMGNRGFREWWRTEKKTPYTKELETLVDNVCSTIKNTGA